MTQATSETKISLAEVNALAEDDFRKRFGGLFEHSPWIVAAAAARRPFASKAAFHAALAETLGMAGAEPQLALLKAHPVLGGQAARRGEITAESRSEQADLGLDRMEAEEDRAFAALNQQYLDRFGFPFIIAVRGQKDRAAILAALRRRLDAPAEAERETALAEVLKIVGFRLDGLLAEEPAERLSLSLHVLDTVSGGPGAGLAFTLSAIGAEEAPHPLAEGVTDKAGRWALGAGVPLLTPGLYELAFAAGAYQAAHQRDSFYDRIVIRFRMQSGGGHYHVPLILAPFGYSTYRGG